MAFLRVARHSRHRLGLRHSVWKQYRFYSAAKAPFLQVSEEIQEAVHAKKPVVALETTIYTHGEFQAVCLPL